MQPFRAQWCLRLRQHGVTEPQGFALEFHDDVVRGLLAEVHPDQKEVFAQTAVPRAGDDFAECVAKDRYDAGFGPGTKPSQVASWIVETMIARKDGTSP